MPHNNASDVSKGRQSSPSAAANGEKPVRQADLVELVMEPLSTQIDQARLEILERIQEVSDSTDMITRQMRRQIDE